MDKEDPNLPTLSERQDLVKKWSYILDGPRWEDLTPEQKADQQEKFWAAKNREVSFNPTMMEGWNPVEGTSFIMPSYNTIDYTRMAYESLRRYYPTNEIVILDDGSSDGSWEMILKWAETDTNLQLWRNTTGNILGHTVTYDIGITMAKNPLVTIFHSDMVCAKNYLENMVKNWRPHAVVCATRIEPEGIYPAGDEKILKPFGMVWNEFKAEEFEAFVEQEQISSKDKMTQGMFAPWLMTRADFLEIGGHDALHFAPYPEEDADLFLRFALAGLYLRQSRDALCYHWISRGHRSWAKNGVGKDDSMFKFYQNRARRNYIRKWHKWMQFDNFHHPIVHPVYDTAFVIRNITKDFLLVMEPWCSIVYVDNWATALEYIKEEQPTTRIDLTNRIRQIPNIPNFRPSNDIVLEFSQSDFMQDGQSSMGVIHSLTDIITDSAEPNSEMKLSFFKLQTRDIKDIKQSLIKVK